MDNTNADVLRVEATAANLPTTIRERQLGFTTDTFRLGFKATGGTTCYYDAAGENHYIGEYLYHQGDTDTYLRFVTNIAQLYAGNSSIIENNATEIIINNDAADLDFEVKGTAASLIQTDAANTRVGINIAAPTTTLDVNGDVTITEYIYHASDSNTHMRFQADQWTLTCGGNTAIDATSSALQTIDQLNIGAATTKAQSLPCIQLDSYAVQLATGLTYELGNNFYYDGSYKLMSANVANKISFGTSGTSFQVAATGAEDSAISWTESLRLDHTTGVVSPKQDFRMLTGKAFRLGNAYNPGYVTASGTLEIEDINGDTYYLLVCTNPESASPSASVSPSSSESSSPSPSA